MTHPYVRAINRFCVLRDAKLFCPGLVSMCKSKKMLGVFSSALISKTTPSNYDFTVDHINYVH